MSASPNPVVQPNVSAGIRLLTKAGTKGMRMVIPVLTYCLLSSATLPLLASTRQDLQKKGLREPIRDSIPSASTSKDVIPQFGDADTNVTVQIGGTAFLHCPVMNPGERPVSYPLISWVRRRDWHILTNGLLTFTSDNRFNVLYKEGSFNWVLQVKWVQERDAGIYECQVSTPTGIISRHVTLTVVTPEAFIQGGEEYHVDQGSTISLVCVIESSPTPPQFVFWYHDNRMVNYDQERGVEVDTSNDSGDRTVSRLVLRGANKKDEGNYTCRPSNTLPAMVHVFVSEGDNMEALHKLSIQESSAVLSSGGNVSISVWLGGLGPSLVVWSLTHLCYHLCRI